MELNVVYVVIAFFANYLLIKKMLSMLNINFMINHRRKWISECYKKKLIQRENAIF